MISPKHTRVLMRAALFAVLIAVATHTRADPDLFGNVKFGQDVVAARSAVVPDAYSFTSAGTFINHEWLSEAMLALAFDAAGSPGLITVKLALLLITGVAIAAALHIAGVRDQHGDLLIAVAAVATFPQTNQIRAQLFSLALFACALLVLVASRKKASTLFWLVPLLAIWPNLHGGWIVGAGVIGVWAAIGIAIDGRSRLAWLAAIVCALAVMATAANPWGWQMWTFLYRTVGVNRADIRDWQPPFALGPMYGVLWLIVAAIALLSYAAAVKRRAVDWRGVAIVAMLGVASFRVNRLTAFFALSTVALLGPRLAEWIAQARPAAAARVPTRLALACAAAVAAIVIAGAATVSARNLSCIAMEADLFPEPEVVSIVQRLGLRGRLLNWFDYGHYAIWHFAPQLKVSIDGRRETLYSKETIDRHLGFYFSPAARQSTLDALRPDYVWLPTDLDVTHDLTSDGWTPLFRGARSTLLARPAYGASLASSPVNGMNPVNVARCFPGP